MISDEICFSKKHKSVHKSVAIVALRSAKTPKKGAFQHKPEAAGKSLLHERYALQLEKIRLGRKKTSTNADNPSGLQPLPSVPVEYRPPSVRQLNLLGGHCCKQT